MNPRYWTAEMDALFAIHNDGEIAAQLDRTVRAVRLRRWKLESGRARPVEAWKADTGAPRNTIEDVWKWIDRRGPDECWPYTGAKRRHGYGAFAVNGKTFPAHRVAYIAATGEHPGDLLVCHRCDNPPCCNPAHLFLGTHADNVRDMLEKGRSRPKRGTGHHAAKLTEDQVREIRRRRGAGEKLVDLAREFGVHGSHLSTICRHPKKSWAHV